MAGKNNLRKVRRHIIMRSLLYAVRAEVTANNSFMVHNTRHDFKASGGRSLLLA
jgi:hypothetical protein